MCKKKLKKGGPLLDFFFFIMITYHGWFQRIKKKLSLSLENPLLNQLTGTFFISEMPNLNPRSPVKAGKRNDYPVNTNIAI